MKSILSAIACLAIFGGVVFAEEKVKVVEVEKVVKVKVVPKKGIAAPQVRPLSGKYHWNHPIFGLGWWAYPQPAVAVPVDFYLDQLGRVVPNGFAYDVNGELVPLVIEKGVYVYPYRVHRGRWIWRR